MEADKMLSIENSELSTRERLSGGIMGFVVADALGVPVEFKSREYLKNHKVTDMEGYGTYSQPKGTCSDDSSMVLATMDGLIKSKNDIDYQLIMDNFLAWMQNGDYTPFNYVFDIGISTSEALNKYQQNKNDGHPEDIICGSVDINSNGNGSLMRILPIAIYLHLNGFNYADNEYTDIIRNMSGMTHSHSYSVSGCYIYSVFVAELLKRKDKTLAYDSLKKIFSREEQKELMKYRGFDFKVYSRIFENDIFKLEENEIKSSGYVVDSLEAAMWCLLTTDNYKDAVLKAINLGGDTDTIGAITGGLAGILYGHDMIPKNWIRDLQKADYIEDLIGAFLGKYLMENRIDSRLINEVIEGLKNKSDEKYFDLLKYLQENHLFNRNCLDDYKIIDKKALEDLSLEEVITKISFISRADRFTNSDINHEEILKLVEMIKKYTSK